MSKSDTVNIKSGAIRQVLKPIKGYVIAATALAALGSICNLIPLAAISHIATTLLSDTGPAIVISTIWWTIAICMLSLFVGMALLSAADVIAHLADNKITHHLRFAIAERLAQVPLGWFSGRTSGEVKQAMQDDIGTLHSLTAHFYTAVGRAVGTIVMSVIYLFAMDWRLAIIALLPFPGFFLFLRRAMQNSSANMQEYLNWLGRINSATVEFVSAIPVIKAYAGAGKAHTNYQEAVDGFANSFVRFTRPLVKAMAHAHAMIAPVTVLSVILLFGTLFLSAGWIAPLDLLPFLIVAPGICAPLLLLHTLLHDVGSARAAAQRVQTLLNTPILETPAAAQQQRPMGTQVCFENVSYQYDNGQQVLDNISFTLAPGSSMAIVGPSGAGKSTLAKLLLRFFDPQAGRITLGGIDLTQLSSAQLYQHIGFVLQDVRLIHASIRENIALGRPAASQQDIERAARLASIHERILALPRGYESVIGEDAQLSGGECQRLSIARAILLDPPILVLDEATAAADASTEVAIQNALSQLAMGKSLLIIAHRLDTVMRANHILVLQEGKIVEQGNHQQLLQQQGLYKRLWDLGHYEITAATLEVTC